ncbi:zinc finger protein 3 homolog isoform X6 [Athalia rosae]|uniref:zinc finger protein 3 homolog isoform X6 n=1 Tax=Athalia rosae TaxID=37344 RepID=UPI002033C588|nr:zinc finger protein 3 homolog isoform X6 [Athalia rosae]
MSSLDYLDLCRLCLVKDGVSVPIFEGEGDVRQIFLKIAACLPVKVAREDKLPKKICDNCVYKVELLYQFWNTTANAEKQLLQWLGEVGLEDKQGYVTGVLNTSTMKEEDDASSVIQSSIATTTPQSGIGIGVIDNIGLGMPFSGTTHQQQLPPTIPINQPIHQALPGPSNQPAPDQLSQTQGNATTRPQDEEEESSEEEDNSDDDCDADDGLPVKEESEEDLGNSRNIEPTTFVNVSLACDEAGPSGLQQQKNTTEIPELSMPQTLNESDAKSGLNLKIAKRPKEISKTPETEHVLITAVDASLKEEGQCLSTQDDRGSSPYEVTIKATNSLPNSDTRVALTYEELQGFETSRESAFETIEDSPCKYDITSEKSITKPVVQSTKYYRCDICEKKFRSKNLFEGHLVAHSDARPYRCDVCSKSFKRTNTLAVHKRIHTRERNFICDVCGRSFVQASQLATHHRRHFEKYTKFCDVCNKGFFTNAELHGHMNVKHEAKEHVCKTCSKAFPNNHTLMRHAKIHEPNFKPVKHQCEFCGKTFAYKNSLVLHVKSHTGDNKFDCHLCGKSVSSKGSLQDHLRLHGGEKSLVCDVCGKAFHKRTTLVVHKRTHTGEKPYSCDTCEKSFTQHSTLVIHKRYHTGQRPYQCNFCTRSFVSRALLNAHNRVHMVNITIQELN